MSCSAQSVPPFGRAKSPGWTQEARAKVCTLALPLLLLLPPPNPAARVPWYPITQQFNTLWPVYNKTLSVR
jgi:hypothetical protein